jgi:cell division protein FtsL
MDQQKKELKYLRWIRIKIQNLQINANQSFLFKALGNLVIFLIISLVFFFVTVRIGFSVLLPRTIFTFFGIIILVILPFLLSYLICLLLFRNTLLKKEKTARIPSTLSKKSKIVYSIIIVAMFAMLIVIVFTQQQTANRQLANAKELFSVSIKGNIAQDRINTTLIEMDIQLTRLDKIYGLNQTAQKIHVILYPDMESLQIGTGSPTWVDAYFSYVSGVPTIYLPAEQSTGSASGTSPLDTTTPGHELAHYVLDQMVGDANRNNVPLWFNEGFAQYESNKQFSYGIFSNRSANQISLWLGNLVDPEVLADKTYILSNIDYPSNDISLYYSASMEFTEYIASKYGGIKEILTKVSEGDNFEDAFYVTTGKTIDTVYSEWYKTFFNVQLPQ